MKLNNKGLTIIELIVSIALISVIMLFMYKLLSDITFERENDYIATLNQEQRIEMIDKIETYLTDYGDTITNYLIINNSLYLFNEQNVMASKVLSYNNNVLSLYKKDDDLISNNDKLANQWELKGGTFGKLICTKINELDITMAQCHLPIYTTSTNNQENNNNTLDDIYFSLMY